MQMKSLEETYRKVIEFKKQKKSPMIVVRNGKIVAVDPNEILPTTNTKMNMRIESFERTMRKGNFSASSNWGAYSFYRSVRLQQKNVLK